MNRVPLARSAAASTQRVSGDRPGDHPAEVALLAGHQDPERAGRLHHAGVDLLDVGALPELVAQRVGLAVAQRDRDQLGDARRRRRRRRRRTAPVSRKAADRLGRSQRARTGWLRRRCRGRRRGRPRCRDRASKSVSSGLGVAAVKVRSSLTKAGADVPSPYTSTRSGTPLSGSAHRSTWSMLDCGADGSTRSPGAEMPGDPAAVDAAYGVGVDVAQQPLGEHRWQQVGGARQPDVGVAAEPRLLVLVAPLEGQPVLVDQVGLAADEQPVDPPVVAAAPPGAHPGAVAEERTDVLEVVGHRQVQGTLGLGVPRPRVVRGRLHPLEQDRCRHVGAPRRNGPEHDRHPDDQRHPECDDAPTAETGHAVRPYGRALRFNGPQKLEDPPPPPPPW